MKTISKQDQEKMREVVEYNEALIAKQTVQLESMEDAPQVTAKPVSKSEALDLRKLLESSAQDIKEDCYRLSNLVIEYALEEEAVNRLKAQLGAQPDGESR